MFEDMSPKKKKVLSWLVFFLLLITISLVSYYYLSYRALDYNMNACLQEFKSSYDSNGLIYEYDLSCRRIFSDIDNSDYCNKVQNKDFCYYSFANFVPYKDAKNNACSKISDSKLKKIC